MFVEKMTTAVLRTDVFVSSYVKDENKNDLLILAKIKVFAVNDC